ncbi:MAG: hypothetical protein JWO58_1273 [Chitinophagaceae bacterium]|nr:hypothetical protein [Chitinophagaceae bacterium]
MGKNGYVEKKEQQGSDVYNRKKEDMYSFSFFFFFFFIGLVPVDSNNGNFPIPK